MKLFTKKRVVTVGVAGSPRPRHFRSGVRMVHVVWVWYRLGQGRSSNHVADKSGWISL